MSKGKYSPSLPLQEDSQFCFNPKGQIPKTWTRTEPYSEEIHSDRYDKDGFDRYGYSAYLSNGSFVGHSRGVDRNGITEFEYMSMSDEEYSKF